MSQDIFEWMLILVRWLHITVGICWIGTSIFFMWLDRSFEKIEGTPDHHIGELWMVHGGGFYRVEKLKMGPTKVPEELHWFKWESYWTFITGITLIGMIFYTGEGTFLLDSEISSITYVEGVIIGVFSMLGSWIFYDFLWERDLTRDKPIIGHALTLLWLAVMSYFLCKTLSGRAAYIHIAGMIGTWMTANVFVRIIPRQVKMVEASKAGKPVNQEWGKNAKNRSTHNTYFTLPILFLMISNHFPSTYGHEYNWILVLLICAAGASIREYFVVRLSNPLRAKKFVALGVSILFAVAINSGRDFSDKADDHDSKETSIENLKTVNDQNGAKVTVKGIIHFDGKVPEGRRLSLPTACAKQFGGDVYSNQIMVSNGKLENVRVRIIQGHEGMKFTDIPKEEVEIDQVGCVYIPRVVAARVGQKVTYINSDPIYHNIRSFSKNNRKFNKGMPDKNQRITKIFKKPELAFQTKCSVHPWMAVHVSIFNHPFFDVTNNKGEFEIKDLPVGKYTLEVYHEVYGLKTRKFVVSESTNPIMEFRYISKK